ncbi:threo-3-hydroxy-L-aspartate ammonia-lyase [Candidimonas humi]|uniref:Threo-3-hydroxy-L-aspartate ammonia-lyase n=1 Tax=Candidimonas humi TaxID=683355 RepID=A0ABV8NU16_9BURK|nr:threo-3-hydroxy-L-aspartate ammonia-lyase [Candidimonas humi]MBV6303341.1 threo-3-hydroxy-L-aspartate ammonia-lyase [Candidimonas humi]
MLIPTLADVGAAASRLAGVAHRTPVLQSRTANARLGAEIFFKPENLQRMGAFKFRGAYNAISQLTDAQRRAGVVTYSSGNHAQATALSARLLGAPAVILMPHDSAKSKVEATRGYGAEVIFYNRFDTDRDALGAAVARERGLTMVPPYDDPHIVAGQGTAAQELMQDVPGLDLVVASLGGGGLLSGTAVAVHGMAPKAQVIGVEPTTGDDGLQSLRAGRVIRIPPPQGLPEGALATHLGALNFEIIKQHVADIATVSDEDIVEAMKFYVQRMKLVVEPTGAMPLAALFNGSIDVRGKRVGIIISGGNVDLERLAALIAAPGTGSAR